MIWLLASDMLELRVDVKWLMANQKAEFNDRQSPKLISQNDHVKKKSPQLLDKANKPQSVKLSATVCHLSMWDCNKQ